MLELVPLRVDVVTCVAEPVAIDAVVGSAPAAALRTAPDEALLVTPAASDVLPPASAVAAAADPDALVVDTSDGWSVWALEGDAARDAFLHVSQLPPPTRLAQGDVAHVPAVVVAEPGRLVLLVAAMWDDLVRERILAECASLGIVERHEPVAWAPPPGARE